MNLLVLDFTGIPAAAEGFDQIDGADHLLSKQLRLQTFAGEQSCLRGNNVKVTSDSADVTIVGNRERAARIFDRSSLRRESLCERAQIADAVFHFLKCRQHRLAVVRYGLAIRCLRGRQIGAVSSALKDRLQRVCAKRPEKARCVQQRCQVAALPSTGTA